MSNKDLITDFNTNTESDTDNGIPNTDMINAYKANSIKVWLREKEIREMLSISRGTLWKWVRQKTFPQPFKIGCCTFWKIKEVMDFVEQTQN